MSDVINTIFIFISLLINLFVTIYLVRNKNKRSNFLRKIILTISLFQVLLYSLLLWYTTSIFKNFILIIFYFVFFFLKPNITIDRGIESFILIVGVYLSKIIVVMITLLGIFFVIEIQKIRCNHTTNYTIPYIISSLCTITFTLFFSECFGFILKGECLFLISFYYLSKCIGDRNKIISKEEGKCLKLTSIYFYVYLLFLFFEYIYVMISGNEILTFLTPLLSLFCNNISLFLQVKTWKLLSTIEAQNEMKKIENKELESMVKW